MKPFLPLNLYLFFIVIFVPFYKLRNTFQRKETTLNDYDYEPIEASEVKEATPKEYLTNPVQTANLLEFSDEEP